MAKGQIQYAQVKRDGDTLVIPQHRLRTEDQLTLSSLGYPSKVDARIVGVEADSIRIQTSKEGDLKSLGTTVFVYAYI